MNFYLIGVDYNNAALEIREEISLKRKEILAFWYSRKPKEAAILFTCNRIEIYGLSRYLDVLLKEIVDLKRNFKGLFENAYIKFSKAEVFEHLLRLACGLKSQLAGEAQILQQLKAWSAQEFLPQPLAELLRQVLPLAEDIRQQSGLNQEEINIATIVFEDLMKRVGNRQRISVIVVGTGKIARLIADNSPENTCLHFISHKRYLKAQLLAQEAAGAAHETADLPGLLLTADALISATSSPHYVIRKQHFSKRQEPIFIYDLAIPRDIEPQVGYIPGVFLKNINDLGALFAQDNQLRQSEIQLAEYLATEIINRYKDGLDETNNPSGHAAQSIGNKTG